MRWLIGFSLFLWVSVAAPVWALPAVYQGESTLFQDTVWSGEVLVDGIVTVAPGVVLEIRPGTVVRFTRMDSNQDGIGEHELFIQGRLMAQGTAEQPIVFTSAEAEPVPGDWGALNMMASEEANQFSHCQIEYAYRGFHAHFAAAKLDHCLLRFNQRGVQFQESEVDIVDSQIVDNLNGLQFRNSQVTLARLQVKGNYWGLRGVYSEVRIEDCLIAENLVNGASFRDSTVEFLGNQVVGNRKGLYLQRSKGRVEGNLFADNSEHGILLEESQADLIGNLVTGNGRAGIKYVNSQGLLQGNRFEQNGEYALVNDGQGAVAAQGNWWGQRSNQEIPTLIRDQSDRPEVGSVDWFNPLWHPPSMPAWPGQNKRLLTPSGLAEDH